MIIRILWSLLAVALLAFAIFESVKYGWIVGGVVIAFALLPDIALIGAFDTNRTGMLRPARVVFYNICHTSWLPVVPMAIGALVPLPELGGVSGGTVLFAAGLAWLLHIATDRAFGYGLRGADGAIRTVGASPAPGFCQA